MPSCVCLSISLILGQCCAPMFSTLWQISERVVDIWVCLGLPSQSWKKSTLNIHWKDWCWGWSSNTFGYLIWRADSLKKTLMLGKAEGKRRRGWQDEMVGWHHWLNGHGFEQTPRDSEGQGSLACCSLWCRKESDMAKWLNDNNNNFLRVQLNLWIKEQELCHPSW